MVVPWVYILVKLRGLNSDIRGYANASGGVIPWTRLYNDTAVAVDQLGKRKGGATVTLDIWHKDFYEFVDIKEQIMVMIDERPLIFSHLCQFQIYLWKD